MCRQKNGHLSNKIRVICVLIVSEIIDYEEISAFNFESDVLKSME